MSKRDPLQDVLSSLPPSLQSKCHAYLQAVEDYKATNAAYQGVLKDRRLKGTAVYQCAEAVGCWECCEEPSKWKVGMILCHLRNRRYYEVVSNGQDQGLRFLCLHARTAYSSKLVGNYGVRGPFVELSIDHPFVKKRANARLAERLEGKDV